MCTLFDTEYRTAVLGEGATVSFTDAESRLIGYMARHPGQTLTRDQILDGMSRDTGEKTDRSVDYLVNRIRRKLQDDPKTPRFIATRYGGGYVWVASEKSTSVTPNDAYVVVGDIKGLDTIAEAQAGALEFAKALTKEINMHLPEGQSAVLLPDSAPSGANTPISVELVFFRDHRGLECVVSCWSGRSRRIFLAKRLKLRTTGGTVLPDGFDLNELTDTILTSRWRSDIDHHLATTPLPVAMQSAATEQDDSRVYHKMMTPKLRQFRKDFPDDPHIKLVYATHIHSDYIINGVDLAQHHRERRVRDVEEIETLVLDALDYAQANPQLAIMAAKLLYFVDKGYKPLALELSERAHEACTSVGSSLAIVGQMHSFVGETDLAISYLKQALALARNNATFERYVLVMLCQALIATNQREDLAPYRERIYGHHPLLRIFLEPLFTDPDQPSLRARGAVMVMPRAKMTALLSHIHFAWSRLYEAPEHQANTIRAPLSLAIRRFGPGVVPDEIRRDMPQLFD